MFFQAEIKQQREKLNKDKQVLQTQMDMLRSSGQLPRDTSLSDLSVDLADKVQSKPDFVPGHKRSASAESFNSNSSPGETKKSSSGNTVKENNFRPEHKSVSKLQSFSFAGNKLPEHLLSATNEQKVGPKNVQQIPSKLLSGGSTVSSSPQQSGLKTVTASNQSLPSLASESGSHGNIGQSMGHSASAGQIGVQGNTQNQYGSSTTVPIGGYQSNRPKQTGKTGLSGVLKLAEKSDKKSKSGSSSQQEKGSQPPAPEPLAQQRPKSGSSAGRNPNVNHKSQKSDSDVIYF